MKSTRLFGIANSSGEKERLENLVRRIKEIENIKNELVVFTPAAVPPQAGCRDG
jgi:hypothetical protein